MAKSIRGAIGQVEKHRERAYTAKQKKFLKLFAENEFKEVKECAAKAGYKGNHWAVVNGLKDDIREIAEMVLVGAAPEAATTLLQVLTSDTPIPGVQNKLAAAKEVLDRAGIVKVDKGMIQHEVKGGVFLMPVKHTLVEQQEDIEDAEYEYVYEEEEPAK